MTFKVPQHYRKSFKPGSGLEHLSSDESYGNNGMFWVPMPTHNSTAVIIASDGEGWEHVSVSFGGDSTRCPTWSEMCYIKDLFWGPEDAVMQLHPAKAEYVNYHQFCLHLWRPNIQTLPTPPASMVGPKGVTP